MCPTASRVPTSHPDHRPFPATPASLVVSPSSSMAVLRGERKNGSRARTACASQGARDTEAASGRASLLGAERLFWAKRSANRQEGPTRATVCLECWELEWLWMFHTLPHKTQKRREHTEMKDVGSHCVNYKWQAFLICSARCQAKLYW